MTHINLTFNSKLWDAITGTELHSFSHKHIVKSVDFSRDNNYLVTGCNDKLLRLFDLNNYTSGKLKPTFSPPTPIFKSIDFDNKRELFLRPDPVIFTGHTSSIKKCIFLDGSNSSSNDEGGRKIVSISDDKSLRVWDTTSQSEIKHLKFESAPNSIELSRDGQWLILTTGTCVEIYDAGSLDLLKKFVVPSKVSAASIHPDKSVFVCGSEDFTLYKYSIETGAELGESKILLLDGFFFSTIFFKIIKIRCSMIS